MILAFHKPYGVISQFTPDGSPNRTLADFGFPKNVYPIGRLDADSEGLLLLSNEAGLNTKLLEPEHGHIRCYWAQVERIPTAETLEELAAGLIIQGYKTRPCKAWILEPQPEVPPRVPPIRVRRNIPDCWIGLELREGKNRQVRRMTAAVGHPTLRLLRASIGALGMSSLGSGTWRELSPDEREMIFSSRDVQSPTRGSGLKTTPGEL